MKNQLVKPGVEYWPEVRWWLAEGFHTDETLKKEIDALYRNGFGAVEFLAMDEPGADSSLYGWGSEEWVHDSHVVMNEATRKKMGVSMTSGTNWSNANLISICPDDRAAAKELDYTAITLSPGEHWEGVLEKCILTQANVHLQELIAVVAIKRVGEKGGQILLDPASSVVLSRQVNEETLSWTAPSDGEYELLAFWIHGTGQTASPAVRTSYTINYIDKYGLDAFKEYWNREIMTPEMRDWVKNNSRVQMYMDSLELSTYGKGGQFWGYHLLEEFGKRRGYDLTPYLPFVLKVGGSMMTEFYYYYTCTDNNFIEKLHNDLYQTMTDLYMENMLKPMQEWLHSVGMTLRAEISYGLPFEISLPGKYVDGIETESLEFCSQLDSYRNLAGPSHLYKRLYSSETGATQMNYMMGLDFYTQIIYTQFAAGVSRTILHGYSSIAGSDKSTYWPGHEGMWPVFSERFGERQPAYQHYHDWTTMIARYQMLLRKGKPRVDIGILRLDFNFNNLYFAKCDKTEKDFYENEFLRNNEGIYWKDMQLQNAGYTYDYFAPQILEEIFVQYEKGELDSEGAAYQAVIIYREMLPVSSARKLLTLAENGLPIIFVNGVIETVRPEGGCKTHKVAACKTVSLKDYDEELEEIVKKIKKCANVRTVEDQNKTIDVLQELGIYPRAGFVVPNKKILTNVREDEEKRYVFAYHYMYTQNSSFPFELKLKGKGKPWKIDCWSGIVSEIGYYKQEGGYTVIPCTLNPGEATMIVLDFSAREEIHAVSVDYGILQKSKGEFILSAENTGCCRIQMSDGSSRDIETEVPAPILLPQWNLEIEDWKEGEKHTIVEDRGLGMVTQEVYYETRKDKIAIGRTDLIPWKDIPKVGTEVSGVGYYTTEVEIPEYWNNDFGAVLFIESTNGNTAAVYVNGIKGNPVDFDAKRVEIGGLLHSGINHICVEVSSTLSNRLLALGYYQKVAERTLEMANNFNSEEAEEQGGLKLNVEPEVQNYGMTGEVKLIFNRRYRF